MDTILLHCIGTCVNGFDEDGVCVLPELSWTCVSDFARAEESAIQLTQTEFAKLAILSDDIRDLIVGHKTEYFLTDDGILMLYDTDNDVHYFFV